MGSTDRRVASRLIYNYFRMGKALIHLPPQERLFVAEFLVSDGRNPFLAYFKPELEEKIELPLPDKLAFLAGVLPEFQLEDVFPFHSHLSEGIHVSDFLQSFFRQPDLFIRIRKGQENAVKSQLDKEGTGFVEESPQTLRLPNGTKLDAMFPSGNALFEVQDLSSQLACSFFKPGKWEHWWDACAASGGKSLALFDQEPTVNLLVSDIRESILANLDQRFREAGIKNYHRHLLDLSEDPEPVLHHFQFDGIILDVPCTGSGTWGRSPEMINQFRSEKILSFQRLQRSILANVQKYLKTGKPLIYITCSVFKEENEENAAFIAREFGLKLEHQQILKGYEQRADTMFVARFIK